MIRIFERTVIQDFSLGSVSADSTGGGPLDFYSMTEQKMFCGVLRNLSISCDSTDFDISIRTKSNAQENTVYEIYRVTNINKYRYDDDLYVGWVNADPINASKLYLVLTNKDLVRSTGSVKIKVVTDINKKYGKSRT